MRDPAQTDAGDPFVTSTLDQLTGTVHRPGGPGYPAAVTGYNRAVAHMPALVVEAQSADDVTAAVRYALAEGLTVTVQNTGHGARRPAGPDTLLLRTGALDSVTVDPVERTATIGAGATVAQVMAAVAPHREAPRPGPGGEEQLPVAEPVAVELHRVPRDVHGRDRRLEHHVDAVIAVE